MIFAGDIPVIVNGDFETGDFQGWTIFTTPQGAFKDGAPIVVLYDTNNDGTATRSAYVTMGVTGGGDAQSAGIFQKIQDSHGDPIGAISVDIAADTSRSDFGNSSAGLFALFVGDMLADPPDFVLADSHDFGKVLPDSPEYATLSTGQISASEATILIQITRAFAVPTELDLYIDNVVQDQNVDPVVGAITAPVDPVQLGTVVFASASFTDANPQDTLTGVFDWGDGTSSAATVTGPNGSGSASGSHTYSQAGVYTVTLTITDSSDGGDSSIFEFVVVFDPNDGFVTGGGWIDSAAGAYVPEPSLVGRANFGFVSKYKQGANTPTGKTQFRFKVANLDFHSDVYDWLLGPKRNSRAPAASTMLAIMGSS